MSNIAELFSVDEPHPIEIIHPQTGDKMGVTIHVVSPDSPRVIQALRKIEVQGYRNNLNRKGKEGVDIDQDIADQLIKQDNALIAASIVSWDWGDMAWDHISGDGGASREDIEYFVNDPRSIHFKRQILAGINSIANFTKTLPTAAPKKPKK